MGFDIQCKCGSGKFVPNPDSMCGKCFKQWEKDVEEKYKKEAKAYEMTVKQYLKFLKQRREDESVRRYARKKEKNEFILNKIRGTKQEPEMKYNTYDSW